MNTKLFPLLLVFLLSASLSSLLSAENLGQFDARSMAMGGTGVAGANSANAAAYNPALMATEVNRKNFSIIPFAIRLNGFDENGFIDTVDETEQSVDDLDSLLDSMDGIARESGCDPGNKPSELCFQHPNMAPTSAKSTEVSGQVISLNNSNLLLNANAGLAIQFGKRIPMAFIADAGANLRVGVKAAESDFSELRAYTNKMEDGSLSGQDFLDLLDEDLVDSDSNNLSFSRSSDDSRQLSSMLEVVGATYTEFGLSFADSFQYTNRDLAVGITPKIVKVEAIKYHQSVEQEDVESDDILDDDNIISKTDFNADIGVVFKPIESQPMQVGITLKNLFTRTYELKKTAQEIELENRANGTGEDAAVAQTDLDSFNFVQQLKIEPQLTAGVAYDFRFIKLMADLDLNEAELLGRTTQHLALGSEFDAKFIKFQLGYRTAIGGDNEDDIITAGTGLGPFDLAVAYSEDNVGAVIQTSISF